MAENTLSLSFRDNDEMRSFVDGMSPSVGGSISLTVTVGVTEYDEDRLTGVVTNIDRDPYADYEEELAGPAEEFAGETAPDVNQFEASTYAEDVPFAEGEMGMEEEAQMPEEVM